MPAHIGVVAHLLLSHLSSAASAQSQCGLSNWDWYIQTTTYMWTHTAHTPVKEPTARLTDTWWDTAWKLLTPHVVSFFEDPSSCVNSCWTCHFSDLYSVGDWEAELDPEHKFRALWSGCQQVNTQLKVCSCYTKRHTQRRSNSTCGSGDNYRRVNKGSVWTGSCHVGLEPCWIHNSHNLSTLVAGSTWIPSSRRPAAALPDRREPDDFTPTPSYATVTGICGITSL